MKPASIELELQSKEAAPRPGPIRTSTEVATLPTTQLQRAVLLIVRFVVLELTLRLWNVVPAVVGYVTAAVLYALLLLRSEAGGSQYTLAASALPQVIRLGFDVIYWLMVFGFGWPLLKDTCALLGIQVDSLFDLPGIRRWARPGDRGTTTGGA